MKFTHSGKSIKGFLFPRKGRGECTKKNYALAAYTAKIEYRQHSCTRRLLMRAVEYLESNKRRCRSFPSPKRTGDLLHATSSTPACEKHISFKNTSTCACNDFCACNAHFFVYASIRDSNERIIPLPLQAEFWIYRRPRSCSTRTFPCMQSTRTGLLSQAHLCIRPSPPNRRNFGLGNVHPCFHLKKCTCRVAGWAFPGGEREGEGRRGRQWNELASQGI
jgi:hypothetical protein